MRCSALFCLVPAALMGCSPDYTGTWTIDSAEFVTNDCLDDGTMLPAGTLEILADRTQIEIDFGDGTEPVDCDRSGATFTCPSEQVASDIQGTARLSTMLDVTGRLGKVLEATRSGSTTCQGGDCATIESISEVSYPCSMTLDFTATL